MIQIRLTSDLSGRGRAGDILTVTVGEGRDLCERGIAAPVGDRGQRSVKGTRVETQCLDRTWTELRD